MTPEGLLSRVGDRIQLHCTAHDPRPLLGEWTAPIDEVTEAEYVAGVTAAVREHMREAHPTPAPENGDTPA